MTENQKRRIEDQRHGQPLDWDETDIEAAREGARLANAFAAAGAAFLAHVDVGGAIAQIPNTNQYVVAGTLPMIAKVLPAEIPGELTDTAIDEVWNAMPGGVDGWLKQFGYRQFARSIARHVLVRVAASMAGTIRPTDDELWEQTIGERDCYHEWADKLAAAISKHFGADIGEHSNMNCPWAEALDVIQNAAPVPAEAPELAEVRRQAFEEAANLCDAVMTGGIEEGCAYWDAAASKCSTEIRALAKEAAEVPSQQGGDHA